MQGSSGAEVLLFLNNLEILFAVSGSALVVRAIWLLTRHQCRYGFTQFGPVAQVFGVVLTILLAGVMFSTGT